MGRVVLTQAGFHGAQSGEWHSLPGSGTADSIRLANNSDIGIPGEWLFKIDDRQVHLCGPGYKGNECIEGAAHAHSAIVTDAPLVGQSARAAPGRTTACVNATA